MMHRWAALLVVLALSALLSSAAAQSTGPPPVGSQRSQGSLDQNFPNPFNPETRITFRVGLEGNPLTCKDPTEQFTVSLKIYNVITELVAIPVMQGGGSFAGRPVEKLVLTCGEYTTYWDGKLRGTNQQVSSGPYVYILDVNGKTTSRRMFVAK